MNSINFRRKLFGREIEVVVYNPEKNTEKILERMYEEALRLQKIFNFYDEDSELSSLNKQRKIKVSKELLEVLKKSLEFSRITRGKYNVALGKEILKRKKGEETLETQDLYQDIKIKSDEVSLEKEDILIDLGSIAKGYITDKLGEFLRNQGVKEFLINSRGDILFSGIYTHIIGVQHPRKKDQLICSIKVKDEGVATSGDYNQFSGSYEKTHILNRNKDIISVTVISKTLEEADVFATALFVSTKKEIQKIMNEHKDIKAMIINKDLNQDFYNSFEDLIA